MKQIFVQPTNGFRAFDNSLKIIIESFARMEIYPSAQTLFIFFKENLKNIKFSHFLKLFSIFDFHG